MQIWYCQIGNLITTGTDNHIRKISYMRINYVEGFEAIIIPNKDVEGNTVMKLKIAGHFCLLIIKVQNMCTV